MTAKVVIHIFHADTDSLNTGSHVAERIRQVRRERGVDLEVYLFGPAERALGAEGAETFTSAIKGLIAEGVAVHTCIDIANAMGEAAAFAEQGLTLEYAREAFVRHALEGATVISF